MTRDSMIKQNSISVCQVFKKTNKKKNPSPCQMTSSHEHSALGPGGTTAHPGINPFSCLRPYVSTISVSKITFTTTAAGCLQKLKLLWYIAAYVCMLFGPIDNTWACCACFFFFFNEGEMLPYAWKNKRRPKLTAPSAKHSWRQENGPHSTFCPALRRMPHCHQC